jgi:threonine/homoserine/homoserine lactone efflux protein
MFYAAAQTFAGGRRAGWLSALGFHIGGYVHIAAAAFGLAVLLETLPVLYNVVKLAGAAYLIWLGIRYLLSPRRVAEPVLTAPAKADRHAIRDSIIVEVLNPKTALFFVSFLPQFTEVSASLPVWAQIIVLGSIVSFMFSATDAVCVLLSDRMTRGFLVSQGAVRLARRIGGGILVALGIDLALSRQ